ncbi:MAG: hypothetical protein M1269_12330 [Chloroflexi bacterium]|nr:hypothetical protein [Chloroflexota bacterium]
MSSSARTFMIGIFILVLSVFLYFQFGLNDIKPGNNPVQKSKPGAATPNTGEDQPVELNKITCPVCSEIVNPANAARQEKFYGRMLYFDREECYQKFLEDPITYSRDLKIKFNIDIKPVPVPMQQEIQPPADQFLTPQDINAPQTLVPETGNPAATPKEDLLEEIPLNGTAPGDGRTPMAEPMPTP